MLPTKMLTIAALLLCATARADDMSAPERAPVELSIEVTAEGDIVRGDPVPLVIRITNRGETPRTVVLPQIAPPDQTTLVLSIRSPDDAASKKVSFPGIYCGAMKAQQGPQSLSVLTIPPNRSQAFRISVGWDFHPADDRQRRWLFPRAGDYSCQVAVFVLSDAAPNVQSVPGNTPLISLQSPPTSIRIVEPSNKADLAAADALMKMREAWLVYSPSCAGSSITTELLDFRKDHATSRYVPFTELAMIYSSYRSAVVARDQGAMREAFGKARDIAAIAETMAWPSGWKTEAHRLLLVLSKDAVPSLP